MFKYIDKQINSFKKANSKYVDVTKILNKPNDDTV